MCPGPPAGGLTGSWATCAAGLDPTKSGGELLWTQAVILNDFGNDLSWPVPALQFALGPTGDVAVGQVLSGTGPTWTSAQSLNGSGNPLVNYGLEGSEELQDAAGTLGLGFDRHHDLVISSDFSGGIGDLNTSALVALGSVSWTNTLSNGSPMFGPWDGDALGNFFAVATPYSPNIPPPGETVALDSTLTLPGLGTYLVRGGTMGESFQAGFSGSFVADQTGGILRFGALAATLDVGCGPMVPGPSASGYLARIGPTWGCVYSQVLPASVAVLADTIGGALLSVTSTTSLDLGCGSLGAVAAGSTFVTRVDLDGACVFGKSLPAPGLTVAFDPGGDVVVSGLVGAGAVDLGGGALAPLGTQDFVIAELDPSGNYLWGTRFGGAGITFASSSVSTSEQGNVYLLTGWSGAVDLGGGPLTAAAGDTVVGSFSSTGAYRWSKDFQFPAGARVGIDGCGALVVATDTDFDPGCGNIFAPPPMPTPYAQTGIARFAP